MKHTGSQSVRRRATLAVGGICVATLAITSCSGPAAESEPTPVASADLQTTVKEAFDYGFPLFELSRFRWNALDTPGTRTSTTLNDFAHSRALAGPDDTWANGPSQDVLYSTAWLDLAHGPVYLDTPDTGDRFYVLTLIDFYSNTFFYAGDRTTGTGQQKYFVVGPDWQGQAPPDATVVKSPTNDVYVNLRVQTTGPADQDAANAVQDGFRFTPTQPGTEPVERIKPVVADLQSYLAVVNQTMALDPPPADENHLVDKFREVGICGADCSWDAISDDAKNAWAEAFSELGDPRHYVKRFENEGRAVGWIDYSPPGVLLGTTQQKDFDMRAYALSAGGGMLGMSREEANYWLVSTDRDINPLIGTKNYTLQLPPGGIPSKSFWSISLYEVRENGNAT